MVGDVGGGGGVGGRGAWHRRGGLGTEGWKVLGAKRG